MATSPRAGEVAGSWKFAALLDGRTIGTHQFEIAPTAGGKLALQSEARFEVRFLGFTAYRYHHQVKEVWSGDCLNSITASTDDDGDLSVVNGEASNGNFLVTARKGKKSSQTSVPGCLLSFAYWNPAQLAAQRKLLDQGTGRIEPVSIAALPASTIDIHNMPTPVTGVRISGLKHPIDVWYTAGNRWVGLDTTVEGGRKLTYRLP
jgi:hypothetical protein